MNKVKLVAVAIALTITFFFSEMVLRAIGYQPGVFRRTEGFRIVDTLILYKNFTTDEKGIYKFSSWITDSLQSNFDCVKGEIINESVNQNLYEVDNISHYLHNSCRLHNPDAANNIRWKFLRWFKDETDNSKFTQQYKSTILTDRLDNDEWETAFMEYAEFPFNKEGFRSIPFKQYKSDRPKVLIIGDSFVYGMSAFPYYNSFADILLTKGYLIYAAGIPGTDPAQYAAILEKYISLLNPDIVILCFFEGNDYMRFSREVSANKPHEHITNAGLLNSSPWGVYLNAEEAYDYYYRLVTIPESSPNLFNKICSKSVIGSLFWNITYKAGWVNHNIANSYDSLMSVSVNPMLTVSYINKIDSTCNAENVRLLNVVIPDCISFHNENKIWLEIDTFMANKVFSGKQYFYPKTVNRKTDIENYGYHFNNSGSEKFADYLDSLIKQTDSVHL